MHVTLVHAYVEASAIDDFIEACRLNHQGSAAESGNRRFDVLQDATDPGHFVLYEAYASEADARAHKETAHYLAWRDSVAGMMREPRRAEPFVGLYPAG
ncbi:MAG: antibiotic biosynthesis monooxygenase [Chromatiaceae bacterium]|nr:antibiotic biosynthesis monooxygenase [Chromatiaceae bacterium]MCP5436542.1 antibiotic biosynthesis monooxygenase [Chromatiaceae bacterium]HPE81443.1 antibiotic biosynthesis monooxygenase [Gammaproteobacteria bacterium]